MWIFQVILAGQYKEYANRLGIYASLEEAKFAVEYTCMNDDCSNLMEGIDEAFIEAVELNSMPDLGSRQGIKICYINEEGLWTIYRPEKHHVIAGFVYA